ncbi:hypothetical protein [Lysinibacillus sphaericus]|uniref:Uncharacterized protein n=1 Tax=Lysinibacillus sphaericus OT4b.31 TaxID=1285586 RepID=R7Z860_LYSSH|nr:hypothetical protein [Lysinibacillus sphaericus]EON70370.1 hypothetical protein H131_21702 [Lysinibacillus sphaericus OT4b.31]
MKKPIKKTWMIASVLTLGMAVYTPLQAGATSAVTTNDVTIQIEQQIKGTIKYIEGDSITIKGNDGKNYYIGFHKFSDEQLEKMNFIEGQEITVEGSVVEDYSEFFTFEVYKKDLPKEITKEELTKLEALFNEMKKLDKEEKYDEVEKIYLEMEKITKPYVLANWQPESFEVYLEEFGFSENNIVIKEKDKEQLKVIYEEWVKLEKDGQEEKALEKLDAFYEIIQPYMDELYPPQTFEEYMTGMELDITKEDLAKLKTIYEEAQKADKDSNDELSEKLWNDFHEMISSYYVPLSFEEYMSDLEFKISEADSKQLKQLYEEALALEKKGEDEKAVEKWEAYYNILDPYFEANKEILISASKLTINGHDYLPQH